MSKPLKPQSLKCHDKANIYCGYAYSTESLAPSILPSQVKGKRRNVAMVHGNMSEETKPCRTIKIWIDLRKLTLLKRTCTLQ